MLLSEHVYCVAVTFKMSEWGEQRICIPFGVKLEHSSMETIWMIQKAAAVGNWWLAASSRQCACSCIMSHAEFFGETSNHLGDTAHLQPRFGTLWLLTFPKLKSPLKGKRFQTIGEIQENRTGQLTVTGGTVWGLKVSPLKGTKASLSCVQCFLYLISSSINVSIFHITWLDTFWTDFVYMGSFQLRKGSQFYCEKNLWWLPGKRGYHS